jgi:hypothetical protein
MSLFAPRTKGEEKFQYCNYGYDKSKYKSFDDCMANYDKYNKSNLPDSLPILVKPTTEEVKQQNLLVRNRGNSLTTEDKFYEMLGIKKTNGGWGIQSRPLGRILVGVILVAGYFAYKKFKK